LLVGTATPNVQEGPNLPLVRIEVLRERTPADKKELFRAVHEALVDALRIPDEDRTQRLIEHDPEDFELPPDKSERFTLVEITMFPGRTLTAKRRLYKAIVAKLGMLGIPGNDVFIVLHEPPMENWGIRGGTPASEIDLGFQVDV
jgi:phenylpyruvate tautomerase PptA (4-oxalocrotonate tautomerase family)